MNDIIKLAKEIRDREIKGLEQLIARLEKHRRNGDWTGLCLRILTSGQIGMAFTFPLYFPLIPNEMKYDFIVRAYIHNGNHIPAIRKALRQARRYGSPVFPQDLAQQEVLTIYRSGREPINKAKYRISWTTSRDIATWFWERKSQFKRTSVHIYQGKIKRDKVIAYTHLRGEQEVMQYRNVFDIEDISTQT